MQSIVNGEILALKQAGGRAGERPISFASLNDHPISPVVPGTWDGKEPRAAGQDLDAIAYIGDYDSAATAISLPILNENDILQVSPASPYVGLTDPASVDAPGEPDSYYPDGRLRRTFARLIPSDAVEALADLRFMRSLDVTRVFVVRDLAPGARYDAAIAGLLEADAAAAGLTVTGSAAIDGPASHAALAGAVAASRAGAVFLAAAPDAAARALLQELHAQLPRLRLFAPSTLATPAFLASLGAASGSTYVTSPILPLDRYPPAAQRVLSDYRSAFGVAPTAYSLYGYEAMASILAAIRKAGPNAGDRLAVDEAYFHLGWRNSVIGRYRIDANGDTSLTSFAGYRVAAGGALTYLRTLSG